MMETGRGVHLLLSALLHHVSHTSVTQGPCYLKEINKEPSCGTAFLTPAPSSIDSSDSYMCCFPQILSAQLCAWHTGCLGRALGGRRQHLQFQGLHVFLEAGRSQSLLSPLRRMGGRPLGRGQGHQPPTVCIALQGAVPSPTKHTHEATAPGPGRTLEAGTAPALCLQGAACGPRTGSID